LLVFVFVIAGILAGCEEGPNTMGRLDLVWGRRGISQGRFQKPRAMAIDGQDRIYVVDMTARIQVFDSDGNFLHAWQTPDHAVGKPSGLSVDRSGRILVADTHYYQLLVYSPQGELLRTLGGTAGQLPGEFGLVTDAVQDSQGNLYVAEYGEYDRIQKFTSDGRFVLQWGGHGSEPGQFRRPQNLAIDQQDHIWVTDACNHRVQVFDTGGNLIKIWGSQGGGPGELYYPYDLVLAPDGTVYIAEFGNHRVQRFTRDGRWLGSWGTHGQEEGKLLNPWALVYDSKGRLHVLDTGNHRVQRVKM
jgi:DNA-binding beta-propeller fold protein YncE